jgi:ketosteroid isomerase-like protein
MTSTGDDVDAIVRVHDRWRESLLGLREEQMRTCYATGENLLMFNLSGAAYHGVDELAQLWDMLRQGVHFDRYDDLTEPVVTVEGDLAVLTVERAVMDLRTSGETLDVPFGAGTLQAGPSPVAVHFRGTEVYRRDDGDGRREWRIWHSAYTPAAGER